MNTCEEIVSTYIKCFHFTNIVELCELDDFHSWQKYLDKSIHLLYINKILISDDFRKTIVLWDKKIMQGGMIILKGGLEEDIKAELKSNPIIKANYIYGTYFQENLTILYKKFNNL